MVYLDRKLRDTKVRNSNHTGLAAPERELSIRFLFMRQPIVNKVVTSLFIVALSLLFFENAWAAFAVSATPYEGGYEIRFGRVSAEMPEVKKEVILKVTTDQNKQYRVYQELIAPLTNSAGRAVEHANLTFYTLQGSNANGTLNAVHRQPMPRGRALLFTSSSSGQSDSLILVYALTLPEGLSSGSYRGRIRFTLEATDHSLTSQQAYINAVVTLETSAGLEMTTSHGGRTIELKAGDLLQERNEVLFKISGNFGQTYRLMQSMPEALRSEEKELLAGSVLFKVSEGRKGVGAGQEELRRGETVLYTSNPRGEGDSVLVSYHLAEPLEAKAGTYRGRMRFSIDSPLNLKGIEQHGLDFLVKIEPAFELKVSPEIGGRIEFRGLKPNEPPKVTEVVLEVQTNLGRPYQVSQKVESLLTNKEGKTIDKDKFVFYEEKITQGGTLKQPSRTPVDTGETTLFVSDGKGSPAEFRIIYELTIPRDLTAGNYSSQITYSILEL